MKALFITADDFEDLELFYPYYRLFEMGWDVDVAGPEEGYVKGKHGYAVKTDLTFGEVDPAGYDLLFVPGGRAPETVRLNKDALEIVNHFFDAGKYVAAVCHGTQVLASADRLRGLRATCWKGVKDDIINAGAIYVDSEVVVDGNLITSRMPDDLPAFMREVASVAAELALEKGERFAA